MDPLTHLAEALNTIGENASGLTRSGPCPELLHPSEFPSGPVLDRLLRQGWSIPTDPGMPTPSDPDVLVREDATIRFGIETQEQYLISPYVLRMVAAIGAPASIMTIENVLAIVLVDAVGGAPGWLADALEDPDRGVDAACIAVISVTDGQGRLVPDGPSA